ESDPLRQSLLEHRDTERSGDGQAETQHHDVPRRLRRRPGPKPGEPTRRGRDGAAPVALSAQGVPRHARRRGRRGQRKLCCRGGPAGEHRRHNHGPQYVRTGSWAVAGYESWRGWWGDDPPYHHPVFVLTHHPREPLEMQGGTTFHFVSDGIESALAHAKDAASGRDVWLAGGASVVNQYLAARLVDEIDISIAPVILGAGARL